MTAQRRAPRTRRGLSARLGVGVVTAAAAMATALLPVASATGSAGAHAQIHSCSMDVFQDLNVHFKTSVGRAHRKFTVEQFHRTFWDGPPKHKRIHLAKGHDRRNTKQVTWSLAGAGSIDAKTLAKLFVDVNVKVSGAYRHHVGSYNRVYKFQSVTRNYVVPRGQSIWWNGTEHYKVPFTVRRCGRSDPHWVNYKKGVAHGYWSTNDPGDPTDMQLTKCKHSSMHDAFSDYVRRLCVK